MLKTNWKKALTMIEFLRPKLLCSIKNIGIIPAGASITFIIANCGNTSESEDSDCKVLGKINTTPKYKNPTAHHKKKFCNVILM